MLLSSCQQVAFTKNTEKREYKQYTYKLRLRLETFAIRFVMLLGTHQCDVALKCK